MQTNYVDNDIIIHVNIILCRNALPEGIPHVAFADILGDKKGCANVTLGGGGGSNEEQKFKWEPSGVAYVSRFVYTTSPISHMIVLRK